MKKTKLVVVDDHSLVIVGIEAILEDYSEFEIIGKSRNGQQGLELIGEVKPDVAVLDIRMPGLSGIEIVEKLKLSNSDVKTLLLSMHDSEEYVLHAIEAGADGYILKGASKEEFINALRTISKGGKYFSGDISTSIINNLKLKKSQPKPVNKVANDFNLTNRELEVLVLVLQGKSNQEVADDLKISKRTSEVHRFNLMKKMGVKNQMELANKARNYQLN